MKKVKITMTGTEAILMHKALEEMGNVTGKASFNISIARNLAVLGAVVKTLEAGLAKSNEYKEYEVDGKKLFDTLSSPTQSGQLRIQAEQYDGYKANLDELKTKHKEAIEAREKQVEEYQLILEEDLEELSLYPIKEDDLPSNIGGNTLAKVIDLIQ